MTVICEAKLEFQFPDTFGSEVSELLAQAKLEKELRKVKIQLSDDAKPTYPQIRSVVAKAEKPVKTAVKTATEQEV